MFHQDFEVKTKFILNICSSMKIIHPSLCLTLKKGVLVTRKHSILTDHIRRFNDEKKIKNTVGNRKKKKRYDKNDREFSSRLFLIINKNTLFTIF